MYYRRRRRQDPYNDSGRLLLYDGMKLGKCHDPESPEWFNFFHKSEEIPNPRQNDKTCPPGQIRRDWIHATQREEAQRQPQEAQAQAQAGVGARARAGQRQDRGQGQGQGWSRGWGQGRGRGWGRGRGRGQIQRLIQSQSQPQGGTPQGGTQGSQETQGKTQGGTRRNATHVQEMIDFHSTAGQNAPEESFVPRARDFLGEEEEVVPAPRRRRHL